MTSNPRRPQKNRILQSHRFCGIRHGAQPRNRLHRLPSGGANRHVSSPRKALKHHLNPHFEEDPRAGPLARNPPLQIHLQTHL